ncbi:hypothetical protein BBJ28_00022129 [Nothophytophthora sp. Chile5]|nr:hypothetical protein BBJ28_00022129 [Nothophytophthora sp. Chile5]
MHSPKSSIMVAKVQICRGDGSSSLPLGDDPGDRGRRAVAQTDVEVGELALRSKAFAAVLLPELWSAHCHKCFVSGVPLSRCGRCRTAYYCSRECQQQDWKPDHRKECKHLAELAALGLRSDQISDVLLLGRVTRRSNQSVAAESEPSPWELVWFEEDLVDQELLLLATLAQKLQLVDGNG